MCALKVQPVFRNECELGQKSTSKLTTVARGRTRSRLAQLEMIKSRTHTRGANALQHDAAQARESVAENINDFKICGGDCGGEISGHHLNC